MSKIKLLAIAVAGLLVLNTATLFFLMMKPGAHHPQAEKDGREGPADIIIKRLHFDNAQVPEYEKLIVQHRASLRTLDDEIQEAKNALYKTLNDTLAGNKDSLMFRLGQLQQQIETVHYDHFAEIKKLCKPEQQQYFNELTNDLAKYFSTIKHRPPPGDGPLQ